MSFAFLAGAAAGAATTKAARRYLTHLVRQKVAMADVLKWALLVYDGVILQKDGTFQAGFSIRGRGLENTPT